MILDFPNKSEREARDMEAFIYAGLAEYDIKSEDAAVIVPALMSVLRSLPSSVHVSAPVGSEDAIAEITRCMHSATNLLILNLLIAYASMHRHGLELKPVVNKPTLSVVK